MEKIISYQNFEMLKNIINALIPVLIPVLITLYVNYINRKNDRKYREKQNINDEMPFLMHNLNFRLKAERNSDGHKIRNTSSINTTISNYKNIALNIIYETKIKHNNEILIKKEYSHMLLNDNSKIDFTVPLINDDAFQLRLITTIIFQDISNRVYLYKIDQIGHDKYNSIINRSCIFNPMIENNINKKYKKIYLEYKDALNEILKINENIKTEEELLERMKKPIKRKENKSSYKGFTDFLKKKGKTILS